MIFRFLKYIRPVWYFNLPRKDKTTVFPNPEKLPKSVLEQLELDEAYNSATSQQRDVAWQAHQKGYIGSVETITFDEQLPLLDEYRFVRKYHKARWATYCMLVRILSFHNAFKEYNAWKATKSIRQIPIFKIPLSDEWAAFKSPLLQDQPKISVVIPTLNRYVYLKDVLGDLEKQDYSNFDVIVIDQSEPFQASFYDDFDLKLTVKNQKEKALWLARNTAIEISDASYFLLFDDDSRVEKDWISNHVKGIDLFKASISSGQSISKEGQLLAENYRYFRISDLLDTGNVLIKRDVFEKIGLFDRQFEKQRMGDGEFGLRAYLHGFLNVSNPYATRVHLKVGTGGLRQMGSWDAFRSQRLFAPKPIPSVLYLYRKYFGLEFTLLELVKSLPPSIVPYQFKRNKKMLVFGIFISLLLLPLLLFQVLKSWHLANIKLRKGAFIKPLKTSV